MAKIERFFHIRPSYNNGGACVRVVGDTDALGQVDVQVAFCHTHSRKKRRADGDKGDVYMKAVGRAVAKQKPVKVVALRYLPRELERIDNEATKRSLGYTIEDLNKGAYDFSVKYFLPKE